MWDLITTSIQADSRTPKNSGGRIKIFSFKGKATPFAGAACFQRYGGKLSWSENTRTTYRPVSPDSPPSCRATPIQPLTRDA